MDENYFRQALKDHRFVYSAELVLGRDHAVEDFEHFINEAGKEESGVRTISVTDLPGGRPALPPEFVTGSIRDHGLTSIAHLSGKDGNRNFIEGRLHGLASLDVENILTMTGDAPSDGFEGRAKPVYDLDSVLILQMINTLRVGHGDGESTSTMTPFDFCPGAVVNPYKVRKADQMMQYYKLELKIASGAQYIITQLGYNLRKLYELKQYMHREGIDNVPVIPSVYVPTAKIARIMQKGNIPGCVVSDELINRLKKEKKPQRLERAALMVAAVKSLGFAGAHIGGFGLKYRDVMHIIETADIIGEAWKDRLDELIMAYPDEWYLFPEGPDGFSDPDGPYQVDSIDDKMPWVQNMCLAANRMFIDDNSVGAHFLQNRLGVDEKPPEGDNWRHGFWYSILRQARTYKKYHLGCVGCGDCIQDHMTYAGCSMGRCYKELRNGPCGGSRPDGTCEVDAEKPCVWTLAYQYTLAATQDPRKFATTLIPPRDWTLNRTNSLANRLADIDNHHRRKTLELPFPELSAENTMLEGDNDACHRRTD